MEKIKRRGYCLMALLCNLIPFAVAFVLLCTAGDRDVALGTGVVFLAIGTILSLVSHLKVEDHLAAWTPAVVAFGASKGGCAAALALRFGLLGERTVSDLCRSLCITVGTETLLMLAFLLLWLTPAMRKHPKLIGLPVPVLLIAGTIVNLVICRDLFGFLLMLNTITLFVCWIPAIIEFDGSDELRWNLDLMSMMYAFLLFIVALVALTEGECCDGLDCGGGSGSGGKKKK